MTQFSDWLDQIEINGVICRAVAEISPKFEDSSLEPVDTLSPTRRSLGYKTGIPKYEISVRHKITVPTREIDYHALQRNSTEFDMAWVEISGQTGLGTKFYARGCRVSSVENSYSTDGDSADDVTIMALDAGVEP